MSFWPFRPSRDADARNRHRTVRRHARLELEALEDRALPSGTAVSGTVISGFVYHDLNNDGLYQPAAGETPYANTGIELLSAAGAVVGTTTTDANGYYQFAADRTIDTSPQSQTYTVSFPSTLTDFSLTQALPQFNPALGTLQSVTFTANDTITSDIKVENTSTTSGTSITGNVGGNMTLTGPGVALTTTPDRDTGTFNASVFDGALDFAGTSGTDFGPRTASASRSVTLTGPALAAFLGTGTVALRQTATATSTASGGGNVLVGITSQAQATVTVTYNYTPSNALRPGNYTIVETTQPPGTVDGKVSSNGTVLNNPPGLDVIPVIVVGPDLPNNDFGKLTPVISAPPPPPPGPPPAADLQIVKTASAATVPVGSAVTYSLTVSNNGPNTATGVTVRDTLPGGVTFVSAAGAGWQESEAAGIVTFTTGSLAAGASSTLAVNILAPSSPGAITNISTVTSNTPDSNPNNNTSQVTVAVVVPPPTGISQQVYAPVPASFPSNGDISVLGKQNLFNVDSPTDPTLLAQISFVDGLYRTLLGRPADNPGLIYWVTQLRNGMSRAQVVQTFWTSTAHRDVEIETLYRTYLGRDAGAGDFDYWNGVFAGGANENAVAAMIIASPEYAASHPDNASFIDSLYRSALGRPADAAGLAFWQGVLGGNSRQDVAYAILSSDEASLRMVSIVYGNDLGRAPSSGEQQYWLGQLQSGVTQDQIAQMILTSDEFYGRAASAA
jgi:uncharacterized repeat protein (TIGR01451 family)